MFADELVRKLEILAKVYVSLICFLTLLPALVPCVKAQGGSVTLNPIDDTYAYFNDDPDSSHGAETQLKVSEIIHVSFLKFNLSNVPEGARGFTAILELYCCSVGSVTSTYPAYLCLNNSWSEETLNYCHLPSMGDLYLDSETVGIEETWHSWIVTTAIENATLRNATEVSIMVGDFFGEAPSPWAYFNSKEAGKYIPKLTIEWNEVPEFPSFLILPLFMIATLLAVIVCKRKKTNRL